MVQVPIAKYVSKQEVVAMQTAVPNPMVAAKDQEEHNRIICQWVSSKNVTVSMDNSRTIIIGEDENDAHCLFAVDGDWVVLDEATDSFSVVRDHIFNLRYAKKED
jgi:hypothetical protein